MRSYLTWQRTSLSLCIAAILTTVGCDIQVGRWSQSKYERTTSHQAPFVSGATLDVDASSGSITVTGSDAATCDIIATITGHAPTEEEARELAEQVEIKLDQAGNILRVRADKPTLGKNRGLSVSYTITVPRQATIECRSSYGGLSVADIEGTVNGKTRSGSIEAEAIRGTTHLNTSYGSISCRDIVGPDITLRSSSGNIDLTDSNAPSMDLSTSHGHVPGQSHEAKWRKFRDVKIGNCTGVYPAV